MSQRLKLYEGIFRKGVDPQIRCEILSVLSGVSAKGGLRIPADDGHGMNVQLQGIEDGIERCVYALQSDGKIFGALSRMSVSMEAESPDNTALEDSGCKHS